MSDMATGVQARKRFFQLAGSLALVAIMYAMPAISHIGISEEIQVVTKQIQNKPQELSLYLLRGNLHRINQHWPEALADYRQVLILDPNNASAELGIGRTWLDQGSPARAIPHLDLALSIEPDNVRALVTRATALKMTGEALAAAADYQTAIDTFVKPHDPLPEYYFERARALEVTGPNYIDAALQTLDAGIARLGSMRILEQYAVQLERRRGNYAAALRRLDAIIDQSERTESLLVIRGDILLEQGQISRAQAAFDEALAAIAALPPPRRDNAAMRQLRAKIAHRDQSRELPDDVE